jgi:predicted nicotinamide N-methyase
MRGAHCTATDIDDLALIVTRALAQEHGVVVDTARVDLDDSAQVQRAVDGADLVLIADLVYNERLAAALVAQLPVLAAANREVLVADSGRPFFDRVRSAAALLPVGIATVPVARAVEGVSVRTATAYRLVRSPRVASASLEIDGEGSSP